MRVSIKTLGCRLNQAESATMAGGFAALGFEVVSEDAQDADIHVLHSCAITHAAEMEALRLVRHARRELGPGAFLVAAGCAAELPGAEERFREAGADLVVRQADKPRLPAIVAETLRSGLRRAAHDDNLAQGIRFDEMPCAGAAREDVSYSYCPPSVLSRPAQARPDPARPAPLFSTTRAILKVQDGCAFRCSYCIVPDTRGAPRSRPFDEVLAEAAAVFARGYREIVLTGVNVACYRSGGRSLRDLAAAILALPERAGGRLRLASIEPATAERELLELAAAESGLCRFFHFPLQSGDDRILRAMRRHYTAAEYEAVVERALELMPDACIGADVITGFPGEDDAAFENTRRLLERHPFGNLHVFPYSERPGTPAATMPGAVPVAVRRERARELVRLADEKRAAFAARFIGREVEVLIERVRPDGTGVGWTGEYVETHIAGCAPEDVNTLRRVVPNVASGSTLLA